MAQIDLMLASCFSSLLRQYLYLPSPLTLVDQRMIVLPLVSLWVCMLFYWTLEYYLEMFLVHVVVFHLHFIQLSSTKIWSRIETKFY
jgi:hypothetical protein